MKLAKTRPALLTLLVIARVSPAVAFLSPASVSRATRSTTCFLDSTEWTSDFDDFVDEDEESSMDFAQIFQKRAGPPDYTAIQTRQFSMGQDLILVDFVGNMGFDEGMYERTFRGDLC